MRTYLCKLPQGLEWYPMRASRPEEAAEDFALMWIGPRLRTAQLEYVSPNECDQLLRVELVDQGQGRFAPDNQRIEVLIWCRGSSCKLTP